MHTELKQLADLLRARYKDPLRQILFFGSRARGDFSEESDYDCLLVFDQVTQDLKTDLDHLAAQWLSEKGIVFSWVAVALADLERLRYEPFLQNARREGIAA
jgi:predicted nucleotidyltransferase